MVLLLASLLLIGGAAANHLPGRVGLERDTLNLAETYRTCTIKRAVEFERSGETADLVVKAAKSACDEEGEVFTGYYVADALIAGVQTNEEMISSLERFEDALTAKALEAVIRRRAAS